MIELTISSIGTPTGTQVTVVFDYGTVTPAVQTQQMTVENNPSGYPAWSRALRVTTDDIVMFRTADNQIALSTDAFAAIAAALDSSLTFPPYISTDPSDDDCVASSTAATFTVVAVSELAETYQWQYESKAVSTLTVTGVFSDGETLTIGLNTDQVTYTFKATLTGAANEILIGASAAASLDNLKSAINGTAGEGSTYGTGTVAHVQIEATTNTDTTQVIQSRLSGTDANSYVTTEVAANASWTSTVMSGGGTWASATGTINSCAYTNDTTATLTCTPTATDQNGTAHRCVVTNSLGSTNSESAVLTIT